MSATFNPFVNWAQNKQKVFMKVDLVGAKDVVLTHEESAIEFSAVGSGAKGVNKYGFKIQLYGSIENSNVSIESSCVRILLSKRQNQTEEFWPRLTTPNVKYPWLKIDFDKWQDPDDSGSEEEQKKRGNLDFNNFNMDAFEQQQADEMVKQLLNSKDMPSFSRNFSLTKPYLITYNSLMFLGYLSILFDLCYGYYKERSEFFPKVWPTVAAKMYYCQMAQFLEIAHVMLGYVKGSVFTTSIQVIGRGFILFATLNGESRMHDKPFVFYLFLAWSLVEIIRYPYYLSALFKKELGLLTWLRYTVWILLYPMGFLCEGIILLRAVPYYQETQIYSYQLPNAANVSFDFPSILTLYLLLFLPGFLLLISHMKKQRAKKLQSKKRN